MIDETWSTNLPDSEGYWMWSQPSVLPQPCAGIVKVEENIFGWPANGKRYGMFGACKPELIGNLTTYWRKYVDVQRLAEGIDG